MNPIHPSIHPISIPINEFVYYSSLSIHLNQIPFLDLALEQGFKVVFPLIGDKTQILTKTRAQMEQLIKNQIDEVGYHSAILMYTFGNELGTATADPSFLATLNYFFNFIRTYQEQKWGRTVPVTCAEVII